MLIVNFFGAPGAGKSTGAAYVFSRLKMAGVKCELATEFAKDAVWENNQEVLRNQIKILDEMIFLWREANETTCSKKNRYEQEYQNAQEEFERKYGVFGEKLRSEEDIEHEKNTGCRIIYGITKAPEYQEIWDKYSQEQRDIEAYRHECKDQAFDLMKEHFYDLWD